MTDTLNATGSLLEPAELHEAFALIRQTLAARQDLSHALQALKTAPDGLLSHALSSEVRVAAAESALVSALHRPDTERLEAARAALDTVARIFDDPAVAELEGVLRRAAGLFEELMTRTASLNAAFGRQRGHFDAKAEGRGRLSWALAALSAEAST